MPFSRTTHAPNTTVKPAFLNAIASPKFDGQIYLDGHNERLGDGSFVDTEGNAKARLWGLSEELKVAPSSGLYVSIQSGIVRENDQHHVIPEQIVECPDNQRNVYIAIVSGGAVQAFPALPASGFLLAKVITSSGTIVQVLDLRARFSISDGATFAPLTDATPDKSSPVWSLSEKRFNTRPLSFNDISEPPPSPSNRLFFLRRANTESASGGGNLQWLPWDVESVQSELSSLRSAVDANVVGIQNAPDLSGYVTTVSLQTTLQNYVTLGQLIFAIAELQSGNT